MVLAILDHYSGINLIRITFITLKNLKYVINLSTSIFIRINNMFYAKIESSSRQFIKPLNKILYKSIHTI